MKDALNQIEGLQLTTKSSGSECILKDRIWFRLKSVTNVQLRGDTMQDQIPYNCSRIARKLKNDAGKCILFARFKWKRKRWECKVIIVGNTQSQKLENEMLENVLLRNILIFISMIKLRLVLQWNIHNSNTKWGAEFLS